MFKFLHAADIHLDSPLRGLDRYEGAPVVECRQATRRALENLVKLATEEHVAFVLIAGDIYDGDWQDYNTGLFFVGQMAKLNSAGIPVVLIRGNHDAQSKMTKDLRLPRDTRVLSYDTPETLRLNNDEVMIHGQSYAHWDLKDNLALNYPKSVRGAFNIGLLHTALEGRDDHDSYAPCTLDDLRARDYHYSALGHVHTRESVRTVDPVIGFPGNIQGRHARESGPKGCLLVTVDDAHNVSAEPRWLDVLRWKMCRIDAAGAVDGDELLDRFHHQLATELATADDRLLALRVEFTGDCPAHATLAADSLKWVNELRGERLQAGDGRVWVEKVLTSTRLESPLGNDDEGPIAVVNTLLDELKTVEKLRKEFDDRALGDLRKKLDRKLHDDLVVQESFGPGRPSVAPSLKRTLIIHTL